ncbi:MAG: YjbQ family protein, partial [Thermomicrobiales bacterium]
ADRPATTAAARAAALSAPVPAKTPAREPGPFATVEGARAHARELGLATSETIPVVDGRLDLGSWQRVFLIELCSARARQVSVQVLSA